MAACVGTPGHNYSRQEPMTHRASPVNRIVKHKAAHSLVWGFEDRSKKECGRTDFEFTDVE